LYSCSFLPQLLYYFSLMLPRLIDLHPLSSLAAAKFQRVF
jgi:hypothetical protein